MGLIKRILAARLLWMVAGVVLSVGLAFLLLREMDYERFAEMAQSTPIGSLLLALAIYIFLNFCRALRFRYLLANQRSALYPLFLISIYHNFLVRTLPFRAGEVSYVTLTKRHLNQPLSEGVSSLLGSRVFDLLLLTLGGAIGFLFAGDGLSESVEGHFIAVLLLGGMVISIIGTYYSGTLSRWGIRALIWTAGWTPLRNFGLIHALEHKVNKLASQLDRMRQPSIFLPTMITSIFTYIASMAFYVVLFNAIGLEANLGVMVAVISVAMYVSFFPLSLSGFGITEGGWALGLVALMGLSVGEAASVGFFLHGCQIVAAASTGLTGYFLLQLSGKATDEQPTAETAAVKPQ